MAGLISAAELGEMGEGEMDGLGRQQSSVSVVSFKDDTYGSPSSPSSKGEAKASSARISERDSEKDSDALDG
jgi:hypothetical protein